MKYSGVILLCCALMVKGQGPVDVTTTISSAVADSNSTTTTTETTSTTKGPTTTTPPPPPTTTTPASTTTPKPSPTPTPTPSPVIPDYPKNSHKWTIENPETNSTCIALKCAMQIIVKHENKTETINVSPYAQPTGDCGEIQKITLTWDSEVTGKQNSLSFTLAANVSKENALTADSGITVGKYALQTVEANLYLNSTNVTNYELKNIDVFQTPLNHSYSCLAEEVLKSSNGDFSLKIREVQLEAFRLTPAGHTEFSAAMQCPADDATDVVPIAVGAALAGLVVIVLIAYLIGRKRSRARGYQSV